MGICRIYNFLLKPVSYLVKGNKATKVHWERRVSRIASLSIRPRFEATMSLDPFEN
jgi:hypothetical protein